MDTEETCIINNQVENKKYELNIQYYINIY